MIDPSATQPTVTGIVLAGGRASRFGGPKLDARIDGESLLALATRAVAEAADEVLIAGPSLPALTGLDRVALRLVIDEQPFEGPLVAIAGALRQAHGALAIVVGGDMPRLAPSVLRAMLDRLATDDNVDALTLEPPPGDRREPRHVATLPLALRVAATLAVAAAAVDAGDRSIVRLLGRLRSIELPVSDWRVLDPDGRTLLDVDRPSDIEVARRTDFR